MINQPQTATFNLFLPVRPVPASRPRVTRFGTYFSKNYEDFRNECFTFLSKIKKQFPQKDSLYHVEIEFICRKPSKPANIYPIGDVDNFLKGPLDALTKVGMFWNDDVQVVDLRGTKRYQRAGEAFGMNLKITEIL